MPNAVTDQLVREGLTQDNANAVSDQLIRESLTQDTAHAVTDQLVRESLIKDNAPAICDGLYREAIVSLGLSAQIHIFGGNFQDSLGRPLANGKLIINLNKDSLVVVEGVQVLSGRRVTMPLDNNGNVVATQPLWATDQMNSSDSAYIVRALSSTGQLCWGPHLVALPSTSASFNVNQWVPIPEGA